MNDATIKDNAVVFERKIINKVRAFLKNHKLKTQKNLAKAINMKESALSQTFSGSINLSVQRLYKISKALELPVTAFWLDDRRLINRSFLNNPDQEKCRQLVLLTNLLKEKSAEEVLFIRMYIEKQLI